MPLSVSDRESQCIDTLVLPARCWCRRLARHRVDCFPTLLGVICVVVYCGTLLFLAPPVELSGFSVDVRQLRSRIFCLSCMVAVLVISAHLGVSWYTMFCTAINVFAV